MGDSTTDTTPPLVTVYMPTRNRCEMATRAVVSVLKQTYPQVELIIVDDGSSDNTVAALCTVVAQVLTTQISSTHGDMKQEGGVRRWEGAFDGKRRVVLLYRNAEGQGAPAARNTAIAAAHGEYITGLDDDDEFLPFRIESLIESYKPGLSCVASTVYVRNRAGRPAPKLPVRRSGTGHITLSRLLHYNRIGNQVLTRTRYLRTVGGFDPEMPAFHDYDLWMRLLARFGPCLKIDRPSYILDQNPERDRISSTSERRLAALDRFENKYRALMKPGHTRSMGLIRAELTKGRIGFGDLIRYAGPGNLVPACIKFFKGLQSPKTPYQ